MVDFWEKIMRETKKLGKKSVAKNFSAQRAVNQFAKIFDRRGVTRTGFDGDCGGAPGRVKAFCCRYK